MPLLACKGETIKDQNFFTSKKYFDNKVDMIDIWQGYFVYLLIGVYLLNGATFWNCSNFPFLNLALTDLAWETQDCSDTSLPRTG